MKTSAKIASVLAALSLAVTPGIAMAGKPDSTGKPTSSTEAKQRGKKCGRGHAKHQPGQKGLRLGKRCQKPKRS